MLKADSYHKISKHAGMLCKSRGKPHTHTHNNGNPNRYISIAAHRCYAQACMHALHTTTDAHSPFAGGVQSVPIACTQTGLAVLEISDECRVLG
jgi:hypothetical protein